jgi:NAD(P)-dependent dehydrogenase (short-subunit alcohol dehydrogenase family)
VSGVAIITGGSRGIGAARLAGAQGYAVAVNYRAVTVSPANVVEDIRAAGGPADAFQADVSDQAAILKLFDGATKAFGPTTALVNSAGIKGGRHTVEEIDGEVLDRVVATNVVGTFLCAQEAVRRMTKSRGGAGGAIVNLSSTAGVFGGAAGGVHYGMTKGAIDSLTIGLGREVAADGVRVKAVRPGLIDTEMNYHPDDPDRLVRLLSQVPMAWICIADEVAEAILWLLSDAASYVTGSMITVSGGR